MMYDQDPKVVDALLKRRFEENAALHGTLGKISRLLKTALVSNDGAGLYDAAYRALALCEAHGHTGTPADKEEG